MATYEVFDQTLFNSLEQAREGNVFYGNQNHSGSQVIYAPTIDAAREKALDLISENLGAYNQALKDPDMRANIKRRLVVCWIGAKGIRYSGLEITLPKDISVEEGE